MTDLLRLFEAGYRAAPPAYRTLGAELDAVRAGKKPMAMFPVGRARDPFVDELAGRAFDRGLALLVDPDDETPDGAHAFVLPLDQAWRVPAYRALWRAAIADGAWSDAAERQVGILLGYTPAQTARWLATQRWTHAAWTATTVYALLEPWQRARTVELGQRCFGPPSAVEGMELFQHSHRHALRRSAHRLAPAQRTIARVALVPDTARALFGKAPRRAKPTVETATVSGRLARELAAAQRSNVELLTARGWA